jgi:hypothetical protein
MNVNDKSSRINLKALVYVSTAYANSNNFDAEEKVYDPKYHPDDLIKLTQALDVETLDKVKFDLK